MKFAARDTEDFPKWCSSDRVGKLGMFRHTVDNEYNLHYEILMIEKVKVGESSYVCLLMIEKACLFCCEIESYSANELRIKNFPEPCRSWKQKLLSVVTHAFFVGVWSSALFLFGKLEIVYGLFGCLMRYPCSNKGHGDSVMIAYLLIRSESFPL